MEIAKYNKIKISAFIRSLILAFIGLVILVLLIYLLTTYSVAFGYLVVIFPIMSVLMWLATRTHGYILSDEGIASCKFSNKVYSRDRYIKWKDVANVEYKPALLKHLGTGRVIILSTNGAIIFVDDSQVDFEKIVSTIYEKSGISRPLQSLPRFEPKKEKPKSTLRKEKKEASIHVQNSSRSDSKKEKPSIATPNEKREVNIHKRNSPRFNSKKEKQSNAFLKLMRRMFYTEDSEYNKRPK